MKHKLVTRLMLTAAVATLAACAIGHDTEKRQAASTAAEEKPAAEPLEGTRHVPAADAQAIGKTPSLDGAAAPLGKIREGNSLPVRAIATMSLAAGTESGYHCCAGDIRAPSEPLDRESYHHFQDNPVKIAAEEPVSTLSIDVDTGAYANVRRFLMAGRLPPEDAVRVEELINYFSYGYQAPADQGTPFSIRTELAPAPWNPGKVLLQIGIKGYELPAQERPAANLVFLIDVSGSMDRPDKLPLLKNAFRLLAGQLAGRDRVSMVVYAGATGVVLEPTPGDEQARILGALDRLSAGGRTNGGAGIRAAYAMAEDAYIADGINRVVLATDGDFNVGTVSFEALKDLIEQKRASGVSLTTLGFGTGNYNDRLMEQLADAGNGNYAYIDTLNEARKVLVEEMSSTLLTIASDVKIQIEFNPAVVAEYRLIGYENRLLQREDFNNDKVDAGEIGTGHTVTAFYEITPVESDARLIDPLRYRADSDTHPADNRTELAFLKMRYKAPGSERSTKIERAIRRSGIREFDDTSDAFRFGAAVAAFGQRLRGATYLGGFDYDAINELARGSRGADTFGYRGEFVSLVSLADSLRTPQRRAER